VRYRQTQIRDRSQGTVCLRACKRYQAHPNDTARRVLSLRSSLHTDPL